MVIVKIFYLYRVTLKLKVIDLVHVYGVTPWPSLSRSWSGSRHLFIDLRIPWPKKHKYRHQEYISSMFLAKDTKNNENSALGPFTFCAARGRATWETNNKCAKMCRRYIGSAIWRRSVKKKPWKSSRWKIQGGTFRSGILFLYIPEYEIYRRP